MRKMTDNEKYARARQMRKEWKEGNYASFADLARAFSVSESQAKSIIYNRVQVRKRPPAGNWRRYTIYGKTFIVYDDGRVWSTASNKFVGSKTPLGYSQLTVQDDKGKLRNLMVHRIMLEVFDRAPEEGEFGRHLDDDPTNNSLPNLAWGQPCDNSEDMVRNEHQAYGDRNGRHKLTEAEVLEFVAAYDGSSHKPFVSAYLKKHKLKVKPLALLRVLRGDAWSCVTGIKYEKKFKVKLDESVVRVMHERFRRSELSRLEFCKKYAQYLNKKGIDVKPGGLKKALSGGSWRNVYGEFYR